MPSSLRLSPISSPGWGGFFISTVSPILVLDRIAQDPDSLDLDLANIAVSHPGGRLAGMADTRGRAGKQEVARLQRNALGRISDGFGDRKHHVRGVIGLHHLAVDPALDLEALAARRQFVGGDDPGTNAAAVVEVLPDVPLGRVALEFPDRALVGAGIAGDA